MAVGSVMTDGLDHAVLYEQALVMLDAAQGQVGRVVIPGA